MISDHSKLCLFLALGSVVTTLGIAMFIYARLPGRRVVVPLMDRWLVPGCVLLGGIAVLLWTVAQLIRNKDIHLE